MEIQRQSGVTLCVNSYGGEIDFQPNEDHTYYARLDVAGYTEAQKKNFLLFTGINVTGVDPSDANGFIGTTNPAITLTDEVVAVSRPARLYAVGAHYEDFAQTSDDEVIRLLDEAAKSDPSTRPA